MSNHNHHRRNGRRIRESSEDFTEILQIALRRNSVGHHRPRSRSVSSSMSMTVDTQEILDLIPQYNPKSSNLSAEQWINVIEKLRQIHRWDDLLTLAGATLRLQDAANRWHHKENLCDWTEFKVRFLRRFSERTKNWETFEQLLRRCKKSDETYEDYVYGVESMALTCACNIQDTITYIISGLGDSWLMSQLRDFDCRIVDELLLRIVKLTDERQQEDLRNQLKNRRRVEDLDAKVLVPVESERREVSLKNPQSDPPIATKKPVSKKNSMCVKCKQFGHYSADCPLKSKPCYNCGLKGHKATECRKDPQKQPQMEVEISCLNCKKAGHEVSECTFANKICFLCREEGHVAKECRAKPNSFKERLDERRDQTQNGRTIFCKVCRSNSHYTSDCRSNESKRSPVPEARPPPPRQEFEERRKMFCRNCKTEGHSTRHCQVIEQEHHREVICRVCGKAGHYPRDCKVIEQQQSREVICRVCGKAGHYPRDCKVNEQQQSREVICRMCGIAGHYPRDCKQSSKPKFAHFCRICKVSGHSTRDCKFREADHSIERDNERRTDAFCRICKTEDHFTRHCKFNESQPNDPNQQRNHHPTESNFKPPNRSNNNSEVKFNSFCKICKIKGHHTRDCKSTESKPSSSQEPEPTREGFCRNCRTFGHSTKNCKELENGKPNNGVKRKINSHPQEPLIKKKISSNVPVYSPEKTSSTAVTTKRNLSELLKPARIDNVYVTALVNLGSDCTTLRRSECEKHGWKLRPCHYQLNALASGASKTLGKITKKVCVEEVELLIDILIVEDHIQDFPLVLGSNFLDHPSVCVIKKYRSLEIKLIDSKGNAASSTQPVLSIKNEPYDDIEENSLFEILDMMDRDLGK